MHLASWNEHYEMVALLIQLGAEEHHQNKSAGIACSVCVGFARSNLLSFLPLPQRGLYLTSESRCGDTSRSFLRAVISAAAGTGRRPPSRCRSPTSRRGRAWSSSARPRSSWTRPSRSSTRSPYAEGKRKGTRSVTSHVQERARLDSRPRKK